MVLISFSDKLIPCFWGGRGGAGWFLCNAQVAEGVEVKNAIFDLLVLGMWTWLLLYCVQLFSGHKAAADLDGIVTRGSKSVFAEWWKVICAPHCEEI